MARAFGRKEEVNSIPRPLSRSPVSTGAQLAMESTGLGLCLLPCSLLWLPDHVSGGPWASASDVQQIQLSLLMGVPISG